MANKQSIGHIIKTAMAQATQDEQGAYIRKHWNPSVGEVIKMAYDPNIQFDLPEGKPPYKVNEYLDQESNLYRELRRLYIFQKGPGNHVSAKTKEVQFISLLENLSQEDAILMASVKDNLLPWGMTEEFVQTELPGLLPSFREKPKANKPVDAVVVPTETTREPETKTEPVIVDVETVAAPAKRPGRPPAVKKTVAPTAKPTEKKRAGRPPMKR